MKQNGKLTWNLERLARKLTVYSIPEDLEDWALVNLQIQEAHDILDNILHPMTLPQ